MQLEAQDRRTLFGVNIPAYQMQRFLMKQPGHKSTLAALKNIFSEFSPGRFYSMVTQAKANGIITQNGEMVELNVDKYSAKTAAGDIIWRSMRMRKQFTRKDIELDTGISNRTVRYWLGEFLKQGLIIANTTAPGITRTYTLISQSQLRPIPKNKKTIPVADAIYQEARKLKIFTRSELTLALAKNNIKTSESYMRNILYQWSKGGTITKAQERHNRNEEILYRFEGGKERPIVI